MNHDPPVCCDSIAANRDTAVAECDRSCTCSPWRLPLTAERGFTHAAERETIDSRAFSAPDAQRGVATALDEGAARERVDAEGTRVNAKDVARRELHGSSQSETRVAGSPLDEFVEQARIAIERARGARSTQSLVLVGPSEGVSGALHRVTTLAEQLGAVTVRGDAVRGASLPALLSPALRTALRQLTRHDRARELAKRADRALAGFTRALQPKFSDISVLDGPTEPGLADNGDLEFDLVTLLEGAGDAARAAETPLVLVLDGLHRLDQIQVGALLAALHRCAQAALPMMLVGGGESTLRASTATARSYAERLLIFFDTS